ncbi:MAG: iron ABC transporter permease [Oscillospiraceae bacterium]|nr:iron ABC transporter permease [Oscillospiraceae bacterium]
MDEHKNPIPFWWLLVLLLFAALIAASLALRYGSARLDLAALLHGLLRTDPAAPEAKILWIVRLPHVAACFLAGVGLAVSGVLLQTATNNPLAGPNVTGVNAGAGFAMVLGLCFAPMAHRLLPLMAFLGAFGCTMLIVLVANQAGGSRVTIVLAGVAVSTLLSAGISMLKLLYPDLAVAYNYFSVGGVSGVTFSALAFPAAIIFAVTLAAMLLSGRMNLLCLGDPIARTLGVRARLLRTLALLLASASAAAAVSFAGLLGFVGLMVPHIARKLLGSGDVRKLLPVSALLGAILVILADLLGRVLFAPSEVPAGIITALIGAPFFFILLLQRRNRL